MWVLILVKEEGCGIMRNCITSERERNEKRERDRQTVKRNNRQIDRQIHRRKQRGRQPN